MHTNGRHVVLICMCCGYLCVHLSASTHPCQVSSFVLEWTGDNGDNRLEQVRGAEDLFSVGFKQSPVGLQLDRNKYYSRTFDPKVGNVQLEPQ